MGENSSMAGHFVVSRATASERHHGNQLNPALPERNDFQKPVCSYSCLIGMALKRSESNSLSVNDIYNHLQEEFPYFKTVNTAAWKNSVRHCLSLGQYFRKVERRECNELQSRKCFHWEVIPAKKEALEQEISKYVFKRSEGAKREETHASQHHATTGSSWYQIEQGMDESSCQLSPQYTASAQQCHLPLPQQSTNESIQAHQNFVNPGSSHTRVATCQHYDSGLHYTTAGHQNTAANYQSHGTSTLSTQQQAHPAHLNTNSGIQKALLEIFAEIYNQAHSDQNTHHLPPAISPSGSEYWQSSSYTSFLSLPQHSTTQQGTTEYTGNDEMLPSFENLHTTGNFTDVSVESIFNSQAACNYEPYIDSQIYDPPCDSALVDPLGPCPVCGLLACASQHHGNSQLDDPFDWLTSSHLAPDPTCSVSELETFDLHLVNEILEERGAQCLYDSFLSLCATNTNKPVLTLCEVPTSNTEGQLMNQSTTAFNVTMHLSIEAIGKRVLSDCISALEGGNNFQGRAIKKKEMTSVRPFSCSKRDMVLDMSFFRSPLPRQDDPLIGSYWCESLSKQSETLTPCDVQMDQNCDEQMLGERKLVAEVFNM